MEYMDSNELEGRIGEDDMESMSSDPPIKPQHKNNENLSRKRKREQEINRIPYATLKEAYDQTDINDLAEQTLNNNGELSAEEYKSLYRYFSGKRDEFITGDKETRALIKKDLNDSASTIKEFKKFREDFAAGIVSKTIQNGWLDTDEGMNYTDLLSNKARLVKYRCGEDDPNCANKDKFGVVLKDVKGTNRGKKRLKDIDERLYGKAGRSQVVDMQEREALEAEKQMLNKLIEQGDGYMNTWVSPDNLNKRIKNKDKASKDILLTMGNNAINQSTGVNPADNMSFNRKATEHQIKTNLIGKSSNIKSLVYDEMIPGRIFYDDLIETAMNNTYGDLGINSKEVNIKDGVNEEEAKIIIDELINNPDHEDLLKEEMLGYFTNYVEKQWNVGKKNRPNPVKTNPFDEKKMMDEVVEKTSARGLSKPIKYVPGAISARLGKQA